MKITKDCNFVTNLHTNYIERCASCRFYHKRLFICNNIRSSEYCKNIPTLIIRNSKCDLWKSEF
jgi:hypothetical protein